MSKQLRKQTSNNQAGEILRLIAKGSSKTAVEVAKEFHKSTGTPASEALLVEAYLARIRSLRENRMDAEAAALTAMVGERYPAARARLAGAARPDSLEDLVRPLADPDLAREHRAIIEANLRRRLDNLAALASCGTLPESHPLRAGAAALDAAFRAVTSGAVNEDALALPEVSHRGPLAPWKMLLRAIAAFYRRDDAACERYLQAIDPDSPPARAVPSLRALLGGHPDPRQLGPAARNLVAQIAGGAGALRGALESLEKAIAANHKRRILDELEKAVSACRRSAPHLLERLRQYVSVRLLETNIDEDRANGAMGGPALKNAHYWMLCARSAEHPRECASEFACFMWEEFRRHAVYERWFPENGVEEAVLYLHMAELLESSIPREELADVRQEFIDDFPGLEPYYFDQPPAIRAVGFAAPGDFYFLYPERLYERACAIDPRAESFARWLAWARSEPGWKPAAEVAEKWRRALPADPRPLLHLMESAEQRGALRKAIDYIEEAERLDPLNPEVRRARLRLPLDKAMRHLRDRNHRAALRELDALADLPQAREGLRAAVVAALRWVACRLRRDERGSAEELARAAGLLQSDAAAGFLFASLGHQSGLILAEADLPASVPLAPQESLASVAARVCALGDEVGIPIDVPVEWERDVIEDLSRDGHRLDVSQLRALAEAALRTNRRELAYAATVAGLARGGPSEARFLLLRARALPPYQADRCFECLTAAADLAGRHRDMKLVDEAIEMRRATSFVGFLRELGGEVVSLRPDGLRQILDRERAAKSFTTARAAGPAPWDFAFDDDLDEDDDSALDPEPRRKRRRRRKRKQAGARPESQKSLF